MSTSRKTITVLAGDIGGTNSRIGLFRTSGQGCRCMFERTFSSRNYTGIEAMLGEFLTGKEQVSAACFGVAGPIVDGQAIATNLPWNIGRKQLEQALQVKKVALINDLMANAYGISILKKKDFEILNVGRRQRGNAAILSTGTGLGIAMLFWDGNKRMPSASEGGHAEFGPKNLLELKLLHYLFDRFGHVSYERVLSGAGLFNIYSFLRDSGDFGREPDWLTTMLERGDPAAVISENAQFKKNALCETALEMFVSIFGSAAGNLALQVMAVSGIYIGGGIPPKIIWKLKEKTFLHAFNDKGRLSRIVERIPVRVIMNDHAALFGSAVYAAGLANAG